MNYHFLKIAFLGTLLILVFSCNSKKQDAFEVYSQQSCQDFQSLIASYSTNMLVPLRPNFLPPKQQEVLCNCLDEVLRKKVKPKYNTAQLEGMQNFQQERLDLLQDVLKNNDNSLMKCLEKQEINEIRVVRRFLKELKEDTTE